MTREILFRGKRIDNGEWVQGSLIHTDDGKDRIATSILTDSDDNEAIMAAAYIVDSDTVGEFTGKFDMNEKPIFDGDIIESVWHRKETCGKDEYREVIHYEYSHFLSPAYTFKQGKSLWQNCLCWFIGFTDIKVIGNVFDNQDLNPEVPYKNDVSKVYISGAITGTTDYMERFAKAEECLKEQGYTVINPAKVNANLPDDTTHKQYMDMSLTMLDMCDGIYMLRDWKMSDGAKEEFKYARRNNIYIMYEKE